PSVDAEDCPDTVGAGHPDTGAPLIGPVIEYANANQGEGLGVVVVGGHVYRGSAIPALDGYYVFGDWSTSFQAPDGQLFVASTNDEPLWEMQRLNNDDAPDGSLGHYLLGFGQDRSGEIYVLATNQTGPTGNTGVVYRMEDAGPVSVEEDLPLASTLSLDPAYPNPFSTATTIRARAESAGEVNITVYDVLGREIKTLVDGQPQSQSYDVVWDGTDAAGRAAPSGVYFIRVRHDDSVQTQTVTLLR
ncbi:MAG: T9SS type A sorting domain-containing protein, partial [Bacteroidota bacterium]